MVQPPCLSHGEGKEGPLYVKVGSGSSPAPPPSPPQGPPIVLPSRAEPAPEFLINKDHESQQHEQGWQGGWVSGPFPCESVGGGRGRAPRGSLLACNASHMPRAEF